MQGNPPKCPGGTSAIRLIAGPVAGRHLRLDLYWTGDRYGQQLRWQEGDRTLASAESVEGDGDQRWPPSPPWQQVVSHHAATPNSQAWLAVGMAGTSHWSASLELGEHEPWIRWDIGCRVRERPSWLGHRLLVRTSETDSRPSGLSPGGALTQCLVLEPHDSARVCVAQQSDEAAGISLRLEPELPRLPATVRWRLHVRFPAVSLP